MNRIHYKINLSFNLGKAIGEVGLLIDSVNAMISNYGVGAGLVVRSRGLSMNLSVNRELTTKERAKLKGLLLEQFEKHFPKWGFKIDSMRRKSSNSHSQSRSR